MFWKKSATPDYLFGHFQRFLEVVNKHAIGANGAVSTRDVLHQYAFIMTYFTATANNVLRMQTREVEIFVAASVNEIFKRIPGIDDNILGHFTNSCADCLRKAELNFGMAAMEYYDTVVANDPLHAIQKDDYVKLVSSASAGLIMLLQRDGYAS